MRKIEIEEQYGIEVTELILTEMTGQTVGILDDGELDYYDYDVENAFRKVNIFKEKIFKDGFSADCIKCGISTHNRFGDQIICIKCYEDLCEDEVVYIG